MAEAFRVGAMPCGMPRTAPEAQQAAADRAPACSFHRFGKDTPGKARVAEKYDASRKTPLRDFAIRKRPGRRIIRRDSRKFALLPHEASEPRKSAVVAPLAEPGPFACRAHAESLRRQSPRRANPSVASAESRSRRKLARRASWRDPGAAARPHSPLLRKGCTARLRRPPR